MKQDSQEDDLFDSWLFGRSKAVRKPVARKLTENTGAVSSLVNQARVEASLRMHFVTPSLAAAERAAVVRTQRLRKRWLLSACAAAAAVVIGMVYVSRDRPVAPAKVIAKGASARMQIQKLPARRVDGTQRVSAVVPESDKRLEALLNRFWLDGKEPPSAIRLSDAVGRLSRSVRQANLLKRPELATFSIEIQKPGVITDDPLVIYSDKLTTAGKALHRLASITGARISYMESKVTLTLPDAHPEDFGKPETRIYRVGPDFVSKLRQMSGQPFDILEDANPFTPPPSPRLQSKALVAETFAEVARLRPRGAQGYDDGSGQISGIAMMNIGPGCLYESTQGTLHARLTTAEHARVANVLEAMTDGGMPGQIVMTWKFAEVPAGMKTEDQIMTDMEFQMFTRGLSQTTGVDLLSYPAVVSRNGTPTTLQSTHDVSSMTENGETLTDFTGIRVGATPTYKGEVIVLEGTADIGIPAEGTVQHMMVDFSATLQDGQTAVMLFPSVQPGRQTIAAITARPIDASGQPQVEESGAVPNPTPADPFAGDSPNK